MTYRPIPAPKIPVQTKLGKFKTAAKLAGRLALSPGLAGGTHAHKNPLKQDPELLEILEDLKQVQNYRQFQGWKGSFLARFETFLIGDGGEQAQAAYDHFRTGMGKFVEKVKQVYRYAELGDISSKRTSVKGRNALNECNRSMKDIIDEEKRLVPSKKSEERMCGYSKYHLGAVLLRDNFSEFVRMNDCNDILQALAKKQENDDSAFAGALAEVADPQQLRQIEEFGEQMQRFRDIMEDLGLFEVMTKCFEFGAEGKEFIFVDLKTGKVGSLSIRMVLSQGAIRAIKDSQGNDTGFVEAAKDNCEKQDAVDMVRRTLATRVMWTDQTKHRVSTNSLGGYERSTTKIDIESSMAELNLELENE